MNHTMNNNAAMTPNQMNMSRSSNEADEAAQMKSQMKTGGNGHNMSPDDPDNPQNWPVLRKIYVSAVATAFAFVVAFGATSYTAGITGVIAQWNVSMQVAILGMSLFFWGVFFAPIYTPHLSERYGRQMVYLVTLPIFALFILGAAFSQTWGSLAVCRFFAGFFGGPSLVLIEGTFADVWSADYTVTYYSVLTLASFIGTACGPLIAGPLFAYGGWRWTQYIVLILALGAYLLGIGAPDTYPREILRRRARRNGVSINLAKAQSGVTLGEMASVTLFHPLKMIVSDPITILVSLYVGFIFATIFQFFIAVPAVLNLVYMFTIQEVGVAFTSAIAGVLIAAMTSTTIENIIRPTVRTSSGHIPIEYRMVPGILGGMGMTASFFWIGWTAEPTTSSFVPIIGTGAFIWGAASVLTSCISYVFDAYPPRGTLSALTAAACFRIFLAGLIPLFIIPMIQNLTGAWAYSTFGFIAAALMFIPWILFFFGAKLRASSAYTPNMMDSDSMTMKMHRDEEMQPREMNMQHHS